METYKSARELIDRKTEILLCNLAASDDQPVLRVTQRVDGIEFGFELTLHPRDQRTIGELLDDVLARLASGGGSGH